MATLWWVRDAPVRSDALVGWSDLQADLSDYAALARVSAYLPQKAVLVSSDLCRASDTADSLQADRRRLPNDPALREIHFGAWELRAFADIHAEDPIRARAFRERPGEVRPPGGESWNEMGARVKIAVRRIAGAYLDADVIIVAHFGPIANQLQSALGVAAGNIFEHVIAPLSVSRLHWQGNSWQAGEVSLQL